MVVAILNGFQMRQVSTEKVPPTVHACGICQRLEGNWILVEWWKIAQKPNLAFAVDAMLVIVWGFFLYSKQPAKPKTSGQIFWGISKVIIWIWRGCGLMKGQTNTLRKTILMELTKEKIEEEVLDLCMNCWQKAKNIPKSKGGYAEEALGRGTESSLLYMRQREWKDCHVCISSNAVLGGFPWTAIYLNSKSSISRSCFLQIKLRSSSGPRIIHGGERCCKMWCWKTSKYITQMPSQHWLGSVAKHHVNT